MAWWWCLDHGSVEDDAGCAPASRLGPYDTREAAGRALQSVQERNERIDAEDRAWEDG